MGMPPYEAFGYHCLGVAAVAAGDLVAARRAYGRVRDLGGLPGMAEVYLGSWAEVELAAGDVEQARRLADEAVTRTSGSDFRWAAPIALVARARVSVGDGDSDRAEALAHEALAIHRVMGGNAQIADILELLAALASGQESDEEAARLMSAAETARQRGGFVRFAIYRDWYEAAVAAMREAMGADDFDAAWAEGAALSLDEAVAYAQRGRGERKRPSSGWASLTPAELDVVRLVGEGLPNKEIAARLFISPRTVQAHLTHVYTKLDVGSRVQLAKEASARL